jgi:hypothetical protein
MHIHTGQAMILRKAIQSKIMRNGFIDFVFLDAREVNTVTTKFGVVLRRICDVCNSADCGEQIACSLLFLVALLLVIQKEKRGPAYSIASLLTVAYSSYLPFFRRRTTIMWKEQTANGENPFLVILSRSIGRKLITSVFFRRTRSTA